ncbi:MAG: calcium/sodium antiporter [Planctomycetota bacterium]|nr:calcium/sodium antiporter [Planctomycetota bacterium]
MKKMEKVLPFLSVIVGFALLSKGADVLVDGSSSLARRLRVSDLVVGLTIVAFGTSAPELIVNIYASIKGNPDIAIGNILGSNIANILLILGVASILYPLTVTSNTTWKEIPLCLLAAVMVGILANDVLINGREPSELSRIDGLVLLVFFLFFMYYVVETVRKEKKRETCEVEFCPLIPDAPESEEKGEESQKKVLGLWKSIVFVVVGLGGLFVGGKWVVDGAVEIARMLGASETLIGLTIVALGTSLPELATSVVAALKKNPEISVGNVVGSNIFNVFFILGTSAVIRPLPFTSSTNADIGMAIFASVLLFAVLFTGKKHTIGRREGVLFLIFYIAYIVYAVIRG